MIVTSVHSHTFIDMYTSVPLLPIYVQNVMSHTHNKEEKEKGEKKA